MDSKTSLSKNRFAERISQSKSYRVQILFIRLAFLLLVSLFHHIILYCNSDDGFIEARNLALSAVALLFQIIICYYAVRIATGRITAQAVQTRSF